MTATDTVAEPVASRHRPHVGGPRFGHQPALDGVRGIAAIAVVLYHAELGWAKGGYVGIDLFFTLSGFLITTLMLDELRRAPRLDLAAFWTRRFRRLLPLMFLVVVVACVWAWIAADPSSLGRIRRDAVGALFYVNNWVQVHDGVGYFEQFAAPTPLTHTWSLAVEEQFYVLWPLVVAVLVGLVRTAARRRAHSPRRTWSTMRWRIGMTGAVGALLSAGLAAFLSFRGMDGGEIYLRTDTRLQAILVGCALAALRWGHWTHPADPPTAAAPDTSEGSVSQDAPDVARSTTQNGAGSRAEQAWGLAAAAALVGFGWLCVTGIDTDLAARGGYLLTALGAGLLITGAVLPGSFVGRVLSFGPLRWFGTISYGLYLWHWPVFAALTERSTGLGFGMVTLLRLTVTVALSVASLHLVETPLRKKVRWSMRWIPVAVAACTVVALVATTGAAESDAQRFAADQTRNAEPPTAPPTTVPPPPATTNALLIGDSFGSSIAAGWVGDAPVSVIDATDPECGAFHFANTEGWDPKAPPCADWRLTLDQRLAAGGVDVVVLAARSWLALSRDATLRESFFGYDVSRPQNLMTDELQLVADRVTAAGATLVLTTIPSTAVSRDERLAVASYEGTAAPFAASRPNEVRAVSLAPGCVSPCTAEAFGATVVDGDTMPSGLAVLAMRQLITQAARDAHLAEYERSIASVAATGGPRVLLVGDSVGWSLGSYWYGADPTPPPDAAVQLWPRGTFECELDSGPRVEQRGVEGISTKCENWRADWKRYVDRFDPDQVVVVLGTWEVFDRRIDGHLLEFATPEWDANLTGLLTEARDILGSKGARVVFLTPPPTRSRPNDAGAPKEWRIPSTERFAHVAGLIRGVADARPDMATVIDLAGFVCPADPCPAEVGGVELRPDGVHYDEVGGKVVADWLTPQLTGLTRAHASEGT